jgi:hypothetical protein
MDGDTVLNPVTKENPYVSEFPNRYARRNFKKSITLQNPLNGVQTVLKVCGNNRANTSKREGVESRFNSITSRKFLKIKK